MEEITTLVIKELELENLDEATRNQVITELGGIIMERCLATLLVKDEDGVFERKVEEGDLAGAFDYADKNIPYLAEILEATAQEVILEYKSA